MIVLFAQLASSRAVLLRLHTCTKSRRGFLSVLQLANAHHRRVQWISKGLLFCFQEGCRLTPGSNWKTLVSSHYLAGPGQKPGWLRGRQQTKRERLKRILSRKSSVKEAHSNLNSA